MSEQADRSQAQEIGRKVVWRLALPTILIMLLSSLDRVNISFAALKMSGDLGLSPSQYGFASGILFLGFLAGQYPSVLLQQRIGFRLWLVLAMGLWGLATAAMGLIETQLQFCLVRVLIGFAEGGLAPGLVLYLSQFSTNRQRARTFVFPMLAIPLSIIMGGPISGLLLEMSPPLGLQAWRWMFFAEAAPTLFVAALAWWYFPNAPAEAGWLDDGEQSWLAENAAVMRERNPHNDWSALRSPLVWLAAVLWFCLLSGSYGIMFWLPQLVHQMSGLSPVAIGFVNTLPWIGGAIGMAVNASHADRTGERFWHVALPALVAGLTLLVGMMPVPSAVSLAVLLIGGTALGAAQGAFWALPAEVLSPRKFVVATVAINIAGSSGGIVTPNLVGLIREWSGGFSGAIILLSAFLLLATLLVVVIGRVAPRSQSSRVA